MLRSIPKAWGIRKLTNGICRPSTVLRNNHALSNYPRTTPSTRSAASRSFASSTLSSPSDPKSPIIEIPANLKGWLESSADIVSDQKDVVDLNRVKGMAATLPTAQGGETEGLKDGSRLREGWHRESSSGSMQQSGFSSVDCSKPSYWFDDDHSVPLPAHTTNLDAPLRRYRHTLLPTLPVHTKDVGIGFIHLQPGQPPARRTVRVSEDSHR